MYQLRPYQQEAVDAAIAWVRKNSSPALLELATEFLERADKKGCFCCVAYGWESAMQAVDDWLSTQ